MYYGQSKQLIQISNPIKNTKKVEKDELPSVFITENLFNENII